MTSSDHSNLVSAILIAIGSRPDIRVWKNATGIGRSFDGERTIAYGLKGSADILGIMAGGRFLAIEVKTGTAVQTKEQKAFEAMVNKFGGLYVLARSIQELIYKLKNS